MPDQRDSDNNAASNSPENLQDAMWRLKVEEDHHGSDTDSHQQNPYPDRPGAADCIYYLRNGVCGYGTNCRYNHPSFNGQGVQNGLELPERAGQPECQYFVKTGTCKFGATCKYHHPRDRHDVRPAPLNILGLPIRQDEKSCPYYMRTGSCKFGYACKFNHPQPATLGAVYPVAGVPGPVYGSTGSSVAPPIGGLSAWPSARPYLSSPRMQGVPAYMPFLLSSSQGSMPMQQGWSTYMGPLSQLPSTDILGPRQIPNTKLQAQSSSSTTTDHPERPDQPECQYYMKTGNCKYGTTCKYHHPKERCSESPYTLGPLGLPLRPGQAVCTFYSMYGSCRYGSACKFDHPVVGFYNYASPSFAHLDPTALFPPNSRNLPQTTRSSATETSLPKPFKNSCETNGMEVKSESDDSNGHVTKPPPNQTSPSSTNTVPSSDSPQNQSD